MEIPGLVETGRWFGNLLRRALLRACRPTLLLLIFCLAAARFAYPQSLPRISDNGIANAASFAQGPVAPGSIISIYGSNFNLASGPHGGGATATALPLPIGIGGTKVIMNGIAAPLYYVDSTQINAQVPWEVNGGASLAVQVVVNGVPSNLATVALAVQAPGIFLVTHASDGTVVTPAKPALPGEYLIIYCTGLGPVTNPPASGEAAPAEAVSTTVVPTVTIGGVPATVTFSGLAPGYVGLYQINVLVPPNLPTGDAVPVTLSVGGSSANAVTVSVNAPPLGRFRLGARGLWVQFEERGWASGYWPGQAIQTFNDFDPVVGSTVSQEVSLQLDKMKAMGLNALTYEFRTADPGDRPNEPFLPPACHINEVLGLQWPQPTPIELANLKAFFDLVQSKRMRIRLHLANTHMEEQPPTNSQTWLGAILREIGKHQALDVVMFDGDQHVNDINGQKICGIPAEPPLWLGLGSVPAQYVKWAISYALSLGIPAAKLSTEAIIGSFLTDSQQPAGSNATDSHLWSPITVLKSILDDLRIPENQRTYAVSFHEHRKCSDSRIRGPCIDLDPHTWAEQTLQSVFATVGAGNGARIVATEMGNNVPVDPNWKTEWAMESLISLMEKYQIEGGSFWRWTSFSNCSKGQGCPNEDSDPTLADPVKRRGVNFVYNPVQKEVLDMGGFHLAVIPNPSFEDDSDSNGVPVLWTVGGNGTGVRYFLPQEAGQPEVPSRGNYALRLTTGNDSRATVSAVSEPLPVTPGTSYTTVANLRFAWSGDPNPSGNPATRPQVFVTIHYLNASGRPTAAPPTIFSYFQENSTKGFQTFVFQYTPPFDAKSVQIEIGAARNGLGAPIILDADNLR